MTPLLGLRILLHTDADAREPVGLARDGIGMISSTRARLASVSPLGVGLLVMAMLLAGVSYHLYRKGLPGAPTVNNHLRAGVAVIERSRIGVLLPGDSDSSVSAHYTLKPGSETGREVELYVRVIASTDVFYAGILLGGDALADELVPLPPYGEQVRIVRTVSRSASIGVPSLDSLYDQRIAFFSFLPRTMQRRSDGRYFGIAAFRVTMRAAAIARENARIVVSTPRLLRGRSCALLDEVRAESQMKTARIRSFEDMRCKEIGDRRSSSQAVQLILPGTDVRVDYLYPQIAQPGRLSWNSYDEVSVQASLALIGEEARGQQLIFFSGIAAGLASGLAPIAVEIVVVRARSRRDDDDDEA